MDWCRTLGLLQTSACSCQPLLGGGSDQMWGWRRIPGWTQNLKVGQLTANFNKKGKKLLYMIIEITRNVHTEQDNKFPTIYTLYITNSQIVWQWIHIKNCGIDKVIFVFWSFSIVQYCRSFIYKYKYQGQSAVHILSLNIVYSICNWKLTNF